MNDRPAVDPRAIALTALIVLQTVCAGFFIFDALHDARELGMGWWRDWHLTVEIAAATGLVAGILVEIVTVRRMLSQARSSERAIGIAQGALGDLVDGYFRDWGLTPAEADVAAFTLKGYSIAEIAGFRGSAEGTVKTHLNAIYRKSGVTGRGQLVSLLIEDLMQSPLVGDARGEVGGQGGFRSGPAANAPSAAPRRSARRR